MTSEASAQSEIREAAAYIGITLFRNNVGETDREINKRFFLAFGVDTMTALSGSRADAVALRAKIMESYT